MKRRSKTTLKVSKRPTKPVKQPEEKKPALPRRSEPTYLEERRPEHYAG
ncbi:MAG TPA: hypothetical protein VEC99_19135 [Clostridia bacterium]|nr:hypothetical protein [Clostridia bacterium]